MRVETCVLATLANLVTAVGNGCFVTSFTLEHTGIILRLSFVVFFTKKKHKYGTGTPYKSIYSRIIKPLLWI